MKFTLKIIKVSSIHEVTDYWSKEDFIALLDEFDYPDGQNADPAELGELLEMAMSDYEPHEAAEILLRYKLGDRLNNGQIKNLSHEMTEDNESEEYPDISFHFPLFCINQLLYASFNGVFSNARATKLEFELILPGENSMEISEDIVLKALSEGLSVQNLIPRLYKKQLNGLEEFSDASKIIWELHNHGNNRYTIITSDYWMNKEDLVEDDFSGVIKEFEKPPFH